MEKEVIYIKYLQTLLENNKIPFQSLEECTKGPDLK
jgi:hypothetical protein